MSKHSNKPKILGALLLGVTVGSVVGTALGFLFAPNKGSKMRKKLKASGNELSGALKEKFLDFVAEIKSQIRTSNTGLTDIADNGLVKIENKKQF